MIRVIKLDDVHCYLEFKIDCFLIAIQTSQIVAD